jgi:elongator complex protein 3
MPSSEFCPELRNAAMLRELHVYGTLVPVGMDAAMTDEWQHRSFGHLLLSRAEEIASSAGFARLAIMSGIGVRPYYRRQGYERSGPYMVKEMQ